MFVKEDIKDAYEKLLSSVYYDNTNLILRNQLTKYAIRLKNEGDNVFNDVLAVVNGAETTELERWKEEITLDYYPKKISKSPSNGKSECANFISNMNYEKELKIDRLSIFAKFRIEIHIISVLWLMKFGPKIEKSLSGCCYANRLSLSGDENEKVTDGKWLYKKYIYQYQRWWGDGIDIANRTLKEDKEDVAIINMDLRDYYHTIRFNFQKLQDEMAIGTDEQPLWDVMVKIHEAYWKKVQSSGMIICENISLGPLPIGLLSSPVLANWYLREFDEEIKRIYKPLYYGRYVDDMMFVVKNTAKDQPKENTVHIVNQHLSGLLEEKKNEDIVAFKLETFKNANLENLSTVELQEEKLYVYEFDKEIPSLTLEKFIEEQKSRSSEFKFFSAEEDEHFSCFDSIRLVDVFETNDTNKGHFKAIESNRFLLSTFLYKLTKKIAEDNDASEKKEVKKVFRYFTGEKIIEYHILWERILSLFVVAGEKDLFYDFVENVEKEIEMLVEIEKYPTTALDITKMVLKEYLSIAEGMAKSLNMSLFEEVGSDYIESHMVRRKYNIWPLQELMPGFENRGLAMRLNELKLPAVLNDNSKLKLTLPYNVKLYEIVLANMLCGNRKSIDAIFDDYKILNGYGINFFIKHIPDTEESNTSGFDMWEVNSDESSSVYGVGTTAKSRRVKPKLSVSLVEMSVSEQVLTESFERTTQKKRNKMYRVLDGITKTFPTDVFILPELALPLELLKTYCQYSAKRDIAFISGLEYWKGVGSNTVLNQIVTCLPVKIGHSYDCIPVIREKNYYAPEEIKNMEYHRLLCRNENERKKTQFLFHWRGHVFASYYCYELASIKDRSLFFSKLDAIYAPVFNKDTHYFSNIVESMVRDMHCYFILCNVSEYGDSRVTRPSKHDVMDGMKVKGGNTKVNDVIVLSEEIDIRSLREHQLLSLAGQKANGKFKCTPPGYNVEDVKRRKENNNLLI